MASLCSISGELPQQPVVSTKSGNVYEKRLIEAYITANGTEPTTGASLTTDDLIDIQGSHTVRPRPPELTSIPALLGAFQQEWDALALEVFTLQQNLAQTRQELSTALYQHDAAVRVIARLTIERDEAREALRNVNVAAPTTNGANGDAMHVDSRPLPEAIKAKIISTQEGLMKTRRKRPIPAEWATSDTISLFKPNKTIKTACVDASFLSVNKPSNVALAGSTGNGAYTISSVDGSVAAITSDEPVTSGLWTASGVAIATSTGKVQVIENGSQVASFTSHAGSVTGLALHASGEILASCSSDKTYALYDLEQNKELTQVQTSSELSCVAFHPDGHLLAVGGKSGQIQVFDVNTNQVGGVFELGGPAKAICFSENGTWLASAIEGATTVNIWDLRKVGTDQGLIHTLDVSHDISSLDWDYTAQYLLVGGSAGITVKQYTKSTKLWSEPFKAPISAAGVGWGDSAQSIVSIGTDGTAVVLSSE